MGHLPGRDFALQGERIEESVEMDGFKRIKLSFLVEPGHRLYSYLFVPTNLKANEKRAAIFALHPTWPTGKDDTAGLSGRKNRAYGLELSQRGYVVMIPDYPSFGDDRTYNFDTDGYVSGTMKGIYNHMRCVDYLCSLDFVDSSRAFFSNSPMEDHNFDVNGVKKAIPIAGEIYKLYGVPGNLQVRYSHSEHDFPPQIRQQAYRFMDKILQHRLQSKE